MRPNKRSCPLPSGYVWTAVSSGYYHACGLTSNSSIVCWGYNGNGQNDVPELPPFARKWVQVSAGPAGPCALSDDGAIKCWGSNYRGEKNPPRSPAPSCTVNEDCTTSLCAAGKCSLKNGASCDANSLCGSGSCMRALDSDVNVCATVSECAVPAPSPPPPSPALAPF